MEEQSNYLKKTKTNIAPGASGYTSSFYKMYWSILKHFVLQVVYQIWVDNCLPHEQQNSVAAVIPIAGKYLLHIEN